MTPENTVYIDARTETDKLREEVAQLNRRMALLLELVQFLYDEHTAFSATNVLERYEDRVAWLAWLEEVTLR